MEKELEPRVANALARIHRSLKTRERIHFLKVVHYMSTHQKLLKGVMIKKISSSRVLQRHLDLLAEAGVTHKDLLRKDVAILSKKPHEEVQKAVQQVYAGLTTQGKENLAKLISHLSRLSTTFGHIPLAEKIKVSSPTVTSQLDRLEKLGVFQEDLVGREFELYTQKPVHRIKTFLERAYQRVGRGGLNPLYKIVETLSQQKHHLSHQKLADLASMSRSRVSAYIKFLNGQGISEQDLFERSKHFETLELPTLEWHKFAERIARRQGMNKRLGKRFATYAFLVDYGAVARAEVTDRRGRNLLGRTRDSVEAEMYNLLKEKPTLRKILPKNHPKYRERLR